MAVYMTAVRIVAMSNPPALGEPELPARNLPGNDVRHPESSQEHPARRTLLQLALLQVFFSYVLVLNPLRGPPLGFTPLCLPSPCTHHSRNTRHTNGHRFSRQ